MHRHCPPALGSSGLPRTTVFQSGRHSGHPSSREAVVLALGKLVLPWLGLGRRLGSQHLCPGTAGCRGDGRAVNFRGRPGLGPLLDNRGRCLQNIQVWQSPFSKFGAQEDPGRSASSLFCAHAPSGTHTRGTHTRGTHLGLAGVHITGPLLVFGLSWPRASRTPSRLSFSGLS